MITAKPSTLGNTNLNAILERINHVLGNLVQTFNIIETYVDKYDPLSVILASEGFVIISTTNMLKGFSPVQLVFGFEMILPIKHKVDWELLRQQNQMQINNDNIRKNNKIVDHDYNVVDKFIIDNNSACKYEIPYKGPFVINQCSTNVTVTL